MQTSDSFASMNLPQATPVRSHRGVEDLIYQLVTVGAILVVLGTVWVF